jgi:ABC-type glycerol-3-phosphate transport system substrate-binding protein
MPLCVDAMVLTYDSEAFDEAGLTYPTESWTIYEVVNAIRSLTKFDESGKAEQMALTPDSQMLAALFRSLLGRGMYDVSVTPNAPQFSGTDAETILDQWVQLQLEGYFEPASEMQTTYPMSIELASNALASYDTTDEPNTSVILLPGSSSGLYIDGVAISSGTQHPDEAYAFIEFLSKSPQAANSFFSARPARQSLVGAEASESIEELDISMTFSPEDSALLDHALAQALPVSEMRYSEYLPSIVDRMVSGQLTAADALQEIEAKAQADYDAAVQRRNTPIVVAAPPADVELAPGEIALKFGLANMMTPLPNQEQWDQLMADFVANDPVVGNIDLRTEILDSSLASMAEQYDCFYLPFNAVPGGQVDTLLNQDPFLDADPNFDRNDVYPNILTQLQQDSRTWAFPIVIQPRVLRVNSEMFDQAGVPVPETGWTADQFADALINLKNSTNEPAFAPGMYSGSPYLMLIAAYGGLLFDYNTNPPTATFTSPDALNAARQVLDMAKNGYIKYETLSITSTDGVVSMTSSEAAIEDMDMSMSMYMMAGDEEGNNPYRMVTYPTGTQYTPVTYEIGAAYISANAQNPEACYDWISQLAQRPDLFGGMPARRSLINDPMVTSSVNPDMLSFYTQFDQMLSRPDLVYIPSSNYSGSDMRSLIVRFLAENWLNAAFDNYVKNDADLEAGMAQAQQYVNDFQPCVEFIPPQDQSDVDETTYIQQFIDCAVAVDPTLDSILNQ